MCDNCLKQYGFDDGGCGANMARAASLYADSLRRAASGGPREEAAKVEGQAWRCLSEVMPGGIRCAMGKHHTDEHKATMANAVISWGKTWDVEEPCPVCGCEVRTPAGYLQCECPVAAPSSPEPPASALAEPHGPTCHRRFCGCRQCDCGAVPPPSGAQEVHLLTKRNGELLNACDSPLRPRLDGSTNIPWLVTCDACRSYAQPHELWKAKVPADYSQEAALRDILTIARESKLSQRDRLASIEAAARAALEPERGADR